MIERQAPRCWYAGCPFVGLNDAVGSDPSKDPLTGMFLGGVDRDGGGVGRKGRQAEPVRGAMSRAWCGRSVL